MQKSAKSPFFAKFLENQIENDNKIVGGGNDKTSQKHDMVYTMKYPSDSEDTGGDYNYTMKYPSDSEDTGSEI